MAAPSWCFHNILCDGCFGVSPRLPVDSPRGGGDVSVVCAGVKKTLAAVNRRSALAVLSVRPPGQGWWPGQKGPFPILLSRWQSMGVRDAAVPPFAARLRCPRLVSRDSWTGCAVWSRPNGIRFLCREAFGMRAGFMLCDAA